MKPFKKTDAEEVFVFPAISIIDCVAFQTSMLISSSNEFCELRRINFKKSSRYSIYDATHGFNLVLSQRRKTVSNKMLDLVSLREEIDQLYNEYIKKQYHTDKSSFWVNQKDKFIDNVVKEIKYTQDVITGNKLVDGDIVENKLKARVGSILNNYHKLTNRQRVYFETLVAQPFVCSYYRKHHDGKKALLNLTALAKLVTGTNNSYHQLKEKTHA